VVKKEIESEEEESESEYESSEEESDEESSGEEVTIIPSKHVTTVKEAGETVKFMSPVRVVNVTEATAEIQPERFNPSPYVSAHILTTQKVDQEFHIERFNPSPYIESHVVSTNEVSAVKKKKTAAVVTYSQSERFNPSPFIEDRITTRQVIYMDANYVPERFNPSPYLESRIIAAGKVAAVAPDQQEQKSIQPAAVAATVMVAEAQVTQVSENTAVQHVTFEAAASPVSEPKPRGAYEKLKNLLELEKQLETEDVPLFDDPMPDVLPAKPEHNPDTLVKETTPPMEEEESVPVRVGPRTAAEYMEEARRIADDNSISLYSPSVLIIKHLVSQQQKLHDMLADMKRQCNNVDTQVKTIRNERFVPQTYVKKKHPWSRLTR